MIAKGPFRYLYQFRWSESSLVLIFVQTIAVALVFNGIHLRPHYPFSIYALVRTVDLDDLNSDPEKNIGHHLLSQYLLKLGNRSDLSIDQILENE